MEKVFVGILIDGKNNEGLYNYDILKINMKKGLDQRIYSFVFFWRLIVFCVVYFLI